MKTIAFKDRLGGSIHAYQNNKKPNQKRWERFFEGLNELKHTGNIIIYRVNGNKLSKISVKQF